MINLPHEAELMKKAICKAVTWRCVGTAEVLGITYLTTGHLETAMHTAGWAAATSLVLYIVHEFAWGH